MKTTTEKVKEFHELFEHPIGESPICVEPLKIRQLRIKLLFEELRELAVAGDVQETFGNLCVDVLNEEFDHDDEGYKDGDNVDKVEELDAITDIQYVLDGKKLTSGLHTVTEAAFDMVHLNNMLKAHRSHEHAEETIKKKNDGDGYVTEERNGRIMLFNSSGKLTKPWDHKKVDLLTLFV